MEEKDSKRINREIAYNNIRELMACREKLRNGLLERKRREGALEIYTALNDAIRRAINFEAEYLKD